MTVESDTQQLRLLSILHYVLGGMTALFACFPLIHVIMGIVIVSGQWGGRPPADPVPATMFGWLFIAMGSFLILCGWTLAIFILFAAYKLARRRSWLFCIVIASVECLFMPLGTILGVFSIITLTRDSVKQLFAAAPSPPAEPAQSQI